MYVYMYVSDQLVAIGYVYGTHTYIHCMYIHTYPRKLIHTAFVHYTAT